MSSSETEIILEFDGKEVTEEKKADITVLKYIDSDEMHIDDLQIITKNKEILSDVLEIKLTIKKNNWNGTGISKVMDCGKFTVDDEECDFENELYIIKASAVTPLSEIRQSARSQAWERFNLKEVAQEIARRNEVNIIYAAQSNPVFARKEQICESDIFFLSRVCRTAGLRLKFTNDSLVIYDPYERSRENPVRVFREGETDISESRLYHRKDDTDYAKCRVSYMDLVKKELIEHIYKRKENGRMIEVRQKVSSTEEASLLAKYIIREKNSKEYTGYLVCSGDISLAVGNIIALSGYGEYDRKYIITKSIQKLNLGLHTTAIWFEMVTEGY